jgi:hypothetical protein
MVKDDYDQFCNVADRAASVKFQEMHLFFAKTPDPMSDSYCITIQVSLLAMRHFHLLCRNTHVLLDRRKARDECIAQASARRNASD